MTLGNLAALRQISVKRMLAYSSVAQAGYLLTGVAANNVTGTQGALYYVIAYTFMTLGAFAVLLAVQREGEQDVDMDRLTGLAARRPALAVMMAIFMFSLAGIPPLSGFFGKLYVFKGAVEGGMAWLAIAGVINSAIASYYYLRVTVSMFMSDRPGSSEPVKSAAVVWASIAICAVGTVLLGLWQTPWMQGISEAIASLPRL
jgi:NADH-quinone oxidoreductase subunit N